MANRERPRSLWSELYPGETMSWDWDDDGADARVVDLWHLRAKLAASSSVVYSKWYRNRATFFSRDAFAGMLGCLVRAARRLERTINPDAADILALLDESSPRSTKELRREVDLTGRLGERRWNVALRELWSRLLVVGAGEVADGAFPSLAVGSTRLMFEDIWEDAHRADPPDDAAMWHAFGEEPLYRKLYEQIRRALTRNDRA
jgi:hypothetical protein